MKIELIEGGKMPERITSGAVGFDCYAREVELHTYVTPVFNESSGGWVDDKDVPYGATIKLGFKVDCSKPISLPVATANYHSMNISFSAGLDFGAFLFPRSGWARKYGFRLKNTIGVIDPDYRGEVIAEVEFDECPPELLEFVQATGRMHEDKVAAPRVCQMVFLPCYVGELTQVDELGDTERGDGGFGSTGHG